MAMAVSKQWTRVRTLGRGGSGAEVFLAADDASGELFAVKAACVSGSAALRREQGVMADLCSPRVVSCIGGRGGREGSYHLFLEFAAGGSLADEVAKNKGLEERVIRAYAADVARGLVYLHGKSMVHGDVKARNVVIGADGRAKLADFGCARKSCAGAKIIGGTPAFMAPELVRGEEQGMAADIWALGCTIVQMAAGRAPWSGMDGDALAVMHRIGYSDAVPEVPEWLSAEAKNFLGGCLARHASDRCTAAQLLDHPFLSSAVFDAKLESVDSKWVSPKSTLDAALFESDSESEEAYDEVSHSAAARIKALSCPASALPEWDFDEGWIDVLSAPTKLSDAVAEPVQVTTNQKDAIKSEVLSSAEPGVLDIAVEDSSVLSAGETDGDSVRQIRNQSLEISVGHELKACKLQFSNRSINTSDFVLAQTLCFLLLLGSHLSSSPLRHVQLANSVKNTTTCSCDCSYPMDLGHL